MALDWWSRRPEPSPELSRALADLGRLGRDRPELAEPSRALAEILRAAFLVPVVVSKGIEPADLAARGEAILAALRPKSPGDDALRAFLRKDREGFHAWAHAILAGHPEIVREQAETAGIDPARALSVVRLAMLPILSATSSATRPEASEHRGDCPNCGDPPLLAESRGLEQRRYLRCGLCASEWPADRLRCPSCGEADPRALTTLDVEGEEGKARLVLCGSCGAGLKVVATLSALSAPGLLVADLATIHLDFLP